MNKKGFSILYGLMLGVVLFLLAMGLAPAINDTTTEARNSTLLNCSTTTNSQTKAVCTSIDAQQLFVGVLFGLAGIVIGGIAVR